MLAVRKGDWWASMVPVGGLRVPRFLVLLRWGESGVKMCLWDGLGGGKSMTGFWSSCESTLVWRLMEGRLCECCVSTGEGDSIWETLLCR